MREKFKNQILENKISPKADLSKLIKDSSKKKAISFVNPFSYPLLAKNPALIENIDCFFSDGSLLCYLTNRHRKLKVDRASFDFSSIADEIFLFASNEKKSVALIGGDKNEIQLAAEYIGNRYSELNLTYYRDGYFSKNDFQSVIKELDDKKIDIVIAGMGTPLQDEFIVSVKENSQSVSLSFTCGGFLSQTSLKGDYYHPIIKKLGLRWLQRCVMHKHVRNRLLKDYPLFVISYLFNKNFFK